MQSQCSETELMGEKVPMRTGSTGTNLNRVPRLWLLEQQCRATSSWAPVRMTPGDFILRLLFLAQTGIGVVGNTFLLSVYTPTSCTGRAPRPTHLILSHMAMANFLILLFKGIPYMVFIWGVTPIVGNGGCKLLHYVPRVARGLSLCTTCLLSNFQANTISSRAGGWVGPKDRVWRNINFSCVLCWVFNLLINVFIPIRVGSLPRNHSSPTVLDYKLCSFEKPEASVPTGVLFLTFPDVVFLGLMARASVHMVLLLYRHHQRVKHIYTNNNSHRFSPETKATRTILLTASTFLFLYSVNSVLVLYNNVFFKSRLWLQHMTTFLVTFYPTVSPLLVLGNHRAPNCYFEMLRK